MANKNDIYAYLDKQVKDKAKKAGTDSLDHKGAKQK